MYLTTNFYENILTFETGSNMRVGKVTQRRISYFTFYTELCWEDKTSDGPGM